MAQRLFSNKTAVDVGHQAWRTPPELFKQLDAEFHFTVDAAADTENSLCERYWDEEMDGLAQDWSGERVFCNPPFGLAGKFVAKASMRQARVSVLLVPANLQNNWWQDYALTADEIRFIKGRAWFFKDGVQGQAANPVGCVLLVWRRHRPGEQKTAWSYTWPGRQTGWLNPMGTPPKPHRDFSGRNAPTKDGDAWSLPPALLKALIRERRPTVIVDGEYPPYYDDWSGERVLAFPPMGDTWRWVEKAHASTARSISLLVPAAIDTTWWEWCVVAGASEVCFFKGAIEFYKDGQPKGSVSPIASALVTWDSMFEGVPRVIWSYAP